MADYYSTSVVSPPLPLDAVEEKLLTEYMRAEVSKTQQEGFDPESFYITVEDTYLDTERLEEMIEEEKGDDAFCSFAQKLLDDYNGPKDGWDDALVSILQRCLQRTGIAYATVECSYACSKNNPDGFGGMAWVVTPDNAKTFSTAQWIEDTIQELVPKDKQ